MSTPKWYDVLHEIISDATARDTIARAVGVHPMTLVRWSTGETQPRLRYIELLLKAVPDDKRAQLTELLHYRSLPPSDQIVATLPTIEHDFIRKIFEMRSRTEANLLFWTLGHAILYHACCLLDPEQLGLSITIAQCTPPACPGIVRSLHTVMSMGTPPWETDISYQRIFLGAESLAGHAVTYGHMRVVDDLREQTRFLPIFSDRFEISAIAQPLFYTNQIAGCLYITSTQPYYFASPIMFSLIDEYAHLIELAFTNEQFYTPSKINLHWMPAFSTQRRQISHVEQRILALMRTDGVSRLQAEQSIWQQIEESLIHFPTEDFSHESDNHQPGEQA